jgi:opacity protein-like surface antigen
MLNSSLLRGRLAGTTAGIVGSERQIGPEDQREMKRVFAIGLAAALTFSQQALAAEGWSGPRVGLRAGWVERSGAVGFQPPSGGVSISDLKAKASLAEARIFAGYDAVLANGLLVGGEAEIGPAGGTRVAHRGGLTAGTTRSERNYAITARIGAAVDAMTLFYLRTGYSAERLHSTYIGPTTRIFPSPKTEATDWAAGAILGIGIERLFSDHVSLQAEYNRRSLSGGYHIQALTAGAAWRF